MLALTAALAIVASDHTALRAAPRPNAAELATLWQGDVVEVRGADAGYLHVYNYRRERGGYLQREGVHTIEVNAAAAPELLAVLRFLRETPGSEALGISYGAAYLRAAPPRELNAEALASIARLAERLADRASAHGQRADVAAHLEVVEQFGVHMRAFEHGGHVQLCYDGELDRRLLALPGALPQQRAEAALALTRPDCIDPDLTPRVRASVDEQRREILEVSENGLDLLTRSRLRARRAAVWAALAWGEARRGEPAGAAAQRALDQLVAVRSEDFGSERHAEYLDALLRVAAIRWAANSVAPAGRLTLRTSAGEPGQTCLAVVKTPAAGSEALTHRCTYGVVWPGSAQVIADSQALVVAVQPLEGWRELWLFHARGGVWGVDVVSPGAVDPEEGYAEFAGFAAASRRLLIVREFKDHGRFRRSFEELRLDDLVVVRQASTPELLRDFGRWQDLSWRRDTLALH